MQPRAAFTRRGFRADPPGGSRGQPEPSADTEAWVRSSSLVEGLLFFFALSVAQLSAVPGL